MAKYSSEPRRLPEPLRYDTRMARRRLGFAIVWLAAAAAAPAIGAGCKSVPTAPAETTPAKPADKPKAEWLANDEVRITYTQGPPAADAAKLRKRAIDASRSVKVSYVERQ